MRTVVVILGIATAVSACGRVAFDETGTDAIGTDAIGTSTAGNAVSGSYVGDQIAGREIDIGFAPVLVGVRDGSGSGPFTFLTSAMPAGVARDIPFPAGPFVTTSIVGLTATGFVLGDNWTTNGDGRTMYWVAWPASPNIAVGSYAGTGTPQTIRFGFRPDWVWVFADGQQPVQRFAVDLDVDNAQAFNSSAVGGDGLITSLDPEGMVVGTAAETNAAGTTYYYAAFRATAGFAAMASYTGTGAPRTFEGLGFTPEIVFRADMQYGGVHLHSRAMGDSTDITFTAAGGQGGFAGAITALLPDGFTEGTMLGNTAGTTYAYAAFAR